MAYIQVNEVNLLSAVREILLGNRAEREAVASSGGSAPPPPPPGRHGAILGSWELALQVEQSTMYRNDVGVCLLLIANAAGLRKLTARADEELARFVSSV